MHSRRSAHLEGSFGVKHGGRKRVGGVVVVEGERAVHVRVRGARNLRPSVFVSGSFILNTTFYSCI